MKYLNRPSLIKHINSHLSNTLDQVLNTKIYKPRLNSEMYTLYITGLSKSNLLLVY